MYLLYKHKLFLFFFWGGFFPSFKYISFFDLFKKKKFKNSYSWASWETCKIYSENKVNFIPWISRFFIFLHKRERNFLDCLISRKEINISQKYKTNNNIKFTTYNTLRLLFQKWIIFLKKIVSPIFQNTSLYKGWKSKK